MYFDVFTANSIFLLKRTKILKIPLNNIPVTMLKYPVDVNALPQNKTTQTNLCRTRVHVQFFHS